MLFKRTASPEVNAEIQMPTRKRIRWQVHVEGYAFVLPALLLLLVFQFMPMLYNLYISFHNWGIRQGEPIGIDNYLALAGDPAFLNSLLVTIFLVLMVVPSEIILGMVIAVLLFQNIRGRAVFRLVFFLPFVTSLVAIGLVWGWIFNSGNFGFMNSFLSVLGMSPSRWLLEPAGILQGLWQALSLQVPRGMNGPSVALAVIAVVTIWHYLGFSILSFMAGLTAIPRDLQEAALIDGAGNWQIMRHIIVPLLSPTSYMLIIIATIGVFQSFSLIYVMTNLGGQGVGSRGDPLGTTQVISLFIFDSFYRLFQTGYGAAAAMILFVIVLVLTLVQRYIGERKVFHLGG